jgi:bleomycin hydrolase
MNKTIFILSNLLFVIIINIQAQYIFNDEIRLPVTQVKNQQATGTCWSFATTSFLESEIIRLTKFHIDLSEMYNVRMAYFEKALNYIFKHGLTNFGEGGLSHDVLRNVELHGIMPLSEYSGIVAGDDSLNHSELSSALKAYLGAVVKVGHPGVHWKNAVEGIINAYMGAVPSTFIYQNKSYGPKSFASAMGIKSENYYSITSFTHHPFYTYFILEIPDNYMNGSFFNVKLDEMVNIIDYALDKGYSLLWDGDISDRGFSQDSGLAILPIATSKDSIFSKPNNEILVTQDNRQENFMNYETTDDHLMHIVGRAKDQNGNVYYIIKNSWGEKGSYKGYLYMSGAYVKMKTISITLHKDAVPKEISKML